MLRTKSIIAFKVAISAIVGVTAMQPAAAQDSCLTVDQTVATIMNIDPRIAAAEARTAQNSFSLQEIRSGQRPQLSAYARAGVGDAQLSSGQVDNEYGLRLSYTLFDFNRNKFSRESAANLLAASEESESAVRQRIILNVLSVLNEYEYATSLVDIYSRRLDILAERVSNTERQVELGSVTRAERSRLLSEYNLIEADRTAAQGDAMTALNNLRTLLDTEAQCFSTSALPSYLERNQFESEDAAIEAASRDSYARELEYSILAAKYDQRAAERAGLPTVNVTGYVAERYNDLLDSYQQRDRIGLEVSMPLYDGGVNKNRAARQSARVDELQAELNAAILDRVIQVKGTWNRHMAVENSQQSVMNAIDNSSGYVDAVLRTFDLGVATVDNLLEAEEDLTNLQIRREALEYEKRQYEIEFFVLKEYF